MDNHILTKAEIEKLTPEKLEEYLQWLTDFEDRNRSVFTETLARYNKIIQAQDALGRSDKEKMDLREIEKIKQKLQNHK